MNACRTYVNDLDGGGQTQTDALTLNEGGFSLVVSDHVLRFCVRAELQKSLKQECRRKKKVKM